MAINHAGLETANRYAAALDASIEYLLFNHGFLRNSPALVDKGTVNGTLSDTATIRQLQMDPFAAASSDSSIESETDETPGSATIAVTRQSLVRRISDLATLTGTAQDLSPRSLAAQMVSAYDMRFDALVATAIATASTNVGSSGVDMSHDNFVDAIYALEVAGARGPFYCMLHGRQLADWQDDLRNETGAIIYNKATTDMLKAHGQGVVGEYMNVVILKSNHVTANGGNREGAMWSHGALGWKRGIVDPRSMPGAGAHTFIQQDELLVEIGREIDGSRTVIAGNAHVGVGVLQQSMLVGIVTDE